MTTPATFFSQLHTFSSGLEYSIANSLAAAKQIKERTKEQTNGTDGQVKIEPEILLQQQEHQQAAWTVLIAQVEQLTLEAQTLKDSVTNGANANSKQQPRLTLVQLQNNLVQQLSNMQEQSSALTRSINALEERSMNVQTSREQRRLSLSDGMVKSPVKSTVQSPSDENSSGVSNHATVGKSSTIVVASATKAKPRKSMSSRHSLAPAPPVARISPAKLAVALRRQSIEARKAQAAEEKAQQLAQQQSLSPAKEDSSMRALPEPDDADQEEEKQSVITTQETISTTRIVSPLASPSRSPTRTASATRGSPRAGPSTVHQTPLHATNTKIPSIMDTPPTPEIKEGSLSLETRRMLGQALAQSAAASAANQSAFVGMMNATQAGQAPSSIPRPVRPANMLDSPATPELVTVTLAREARQLRKQSLGGTATPATARKTPRDSLAPSTSSRLNLMNNPTTPARQNLMFQGTTPSTNQRRAASASGSRIGSGASVSTPPLVPSTPAVASSVSGDLMSPDEFAALIDQPQTASPEINSSITTPELQTRFKPSSIAWTSGAEPAASTPPTSKRPSSAMKKQQRTPSKSPSASAKSEVSLTPAQAASSSASSSIPIPSAAVSATPRSAKKGILKTPKSSVRKSARLAPGSAFHAAASSTSPEPRPSSALQSIDSIAPMPFTSPMLKKSASMDSATPATPATPMLLSALSASFHPQTPSAAQNFAAVLNAAHVPPSSAAKRRAASAK